MENSIQIYHHLGLGDHIICNGLIREISKKFDVVYLITKEKYIKSVKYMYRDLHKIILVPVLNDDDANKKIDKNIGLIKIGFDKFNRKYEVFDQSFYSQVGLDFSHRWKSFYFERNSTQEEHLYRILNPTNEPYIFIHDDPSRLLNIDFVKIRTKYKKIRIYDEIKKTKGKLLDEFTIFDYSMVLERASEIHCIDSSFKNLVDSMANIKAKLYFHQYVKGDKECSTVREYWKVIDEPTLFFKLYINVLRIIHRIIHSIYL